MTISDHKKSWNIPKVEYYETAALQALSRGEATKQQQIDALKCIIDKICMRDEETFHLESDRISTFYQGRRNAGNLIVKELNINLQELLEKEKLKRGELNNE